MNVFCSFESFDVVSDSLCFVNVDSVDACSVAGNTIQLSGFDYSCSHLIRFDKWIDALIFFQLNDMKPVDMIETAHYLKLRNRRKQFFSSLRYNL